VGLLISGRSSGWDDVEKDEKVETLLKSLKTIMDILP